MNASKPTHGISYGIHRGLMPPADDLHVLNAFVGDILEALDLGRPTSSADVTIKVRVRPDKIVIDAAFSAVEGVSS